MTPLWEILVAVSLVASGGVTLAAGLGLWRLPDFFLRMHAPAIASTLGAWLVTFGSIVHFSAAAGSPSLHTWLIIIVLSITAPISGIVLARAALFRRRQAGDALPPPLGTRPGSSRAPAADAEGSRQGV